MAIDESPVTLGAVFFSRTPSMLGLSRPTDMMLERVDRNGHLLDARLLIAAKLGIEGCCTKPLAAMGGNQCDLYCEDCCMTIYSVNWWAGV